MYVHGQTTKRPATEAGNAAQRARNARLAAELRQLEAITERLHAEVLERRTQLEQEVAESRRVLEALRSERTDLDKQSQDLIRYRARLAELPPPVYGGRDGLLAACAEIEQHDNPGKQPGPSHGTKARYYEHGCICPECLAWYEKHKAQAAAWHKTRKARRHLQAVAA